METLLHALQPVIARNPRLIIWVSGYNKSATITTDLTENQIRDYALCNGLADAKVCPLNEQWRALK